MYGLRVWVLAGTGGGYHTLVDTLTHPLVQGVHVAQIGIGAVAETAAPTQL
jgi:hypothetical protein